jgi:hypothetical protein
MDISGGGEAEEKEDNGELSCSVTTDTFFISYVTISC